MTLAITTQPPEGIDVPLLTVTLVPPLVPLAPAQRGNASTVAASIAGVPSVRPAGSVSVSDADIVRADALMLPSTMRSFELPPAAICTGLNSLPTLGGSKVLNVAVAGLGLLTPSLLCSAPSGMVLT